MPTSNPQANNTPAAQKWYTIRASARAGAINAAAAEILIYGDIGESWYGDTIAAKDFVREIAALDVDVLTIRINSYGGSVTDGIAIHNAIKRHKAKVTIVVDAIAASIASLIAMAGDTVQMAENAQLMIHAPWGYQVGNSAAMREYADMLDSWADAMSTTYAGKTGKDKADVLAMLTDGKDHWYTAEQALAEKFIDETVAAVPVAASASLTAAAKARHQAAFRPPVSPAASAATTTKPSTKESNPMPPENTDGPVNAAQLQQERDAAARAALQADQTRRISISELFASFAERAGVTALMATCQNDINCSADDAGKKLLAHLGKDATPTAGGNIITLEDERDKMRAGMQASLMARSKIAKDDAANNYRGFTLMDIARECLARAGVKAGGMDKMRLVAAAFTHTGSDFPQLLSNIAEKAMLKGYEEADETFQLWTAEGTLSDFKPGMRLDLNTFPALDRVRDGGEYRYASVGERGEQVQLATYGKLFSITRQTIINDDLDAFAKLPRIMGRAAIRTIGDLVYAILTSNPAMADGNPLFHATHNNLLAGGPISTGGVDAARVLMGKQSDGNATLNIRLANLIVPLALEGLANVVRDSEYEVGAAAKNNTVPNSVRNTFKVIADARLDANSAAKWYGTADHAKYDTVEVSYLDGQTAPTLEQQEGWNVDGTEFKVRMDAGVKALDFRTLVHNPGQ
ncbi:ClpP-like prohead protease/major capsid protein fusion protein [Pseudoduganella albidiflava]|uniref:ATP-dependent Clp protease proteolytic subunit n=1 Tax=Pseudoduganella albidiflava TaxID=321983 RepID=A0A411X329_9BURK|nr:ClpP-like prohead protease/major capsid protein fusion protein [Pseudoduganella albidiflava]QBI03293.1 Clp protease ClpP [Pseudoduganella albidiflava]GGY68018.1 ATP-dependent Clp protease proteolytic subunit [Pseudoduganella albidiflava]